MFKKTRIGMLLLGLLVVVLLSAFASTSVAEAVGFWTGDPDPYACNDFEDCFSTMFVCIDGKTYEVGIFFDPATTEEQLMIDWAITYSGIDLTVGACPANASWRYTGRWVHSYPGKTWWCNLISEVGEDKDAARFSNPAYVDETCGVHEIYGDFELVGNAEDYLLCKEKKWPNGDLGCGNHYDTSVP